MKKEQQKSLNGKTFITRLNYKVAVLQSLPHTSLPMGYLRAAESSTASRTSSRSLYSTRLWPQFLMPALSFSPFGLPVKLLFFFFKKIQLPVTFVTEPGSFCLTSSKQKHWNARKQRVYSQGSQSRDRTSLKPASGRQGAWGIYEIKTKGAGQSEALGRVGVGPKEPDWKKVWLICAGGTKLQASAGSEVEALSTNWGWSF